MQKRTFFGLLLIASVLVGCTPLGENVVRKEKSNSEDEGIALAGARHDLNIEPMIDPSTRRIIRSYGSTVRKYAKRYGFDWRLILAVMKVESRFSVKARSEKGAAGLMQIMPMTSKEVAGILGIEDMAHPKNNIRGGVFYMKRLYNLFEGAEEPDRIKLALAAYNAGMGRIYDAQEFVAYFQEDPTKWASIRDALPFLSKRYYTLHRNIWPEQKPKAGWFGNSSQTVEYVERIMDFYDEYRLVLN